MIRKVSSQKGEDMNVRALKFLMDNAKDKPNEDFAHLVLKDNYAVCALADGITRFVPEGKKYLRPSHARTAAEIFCRRSAYALETRIEEHGKMCLEIRIIQGAFDTANKSIAQLNARLGLSKENTDYLENDLFGCQGVLGALVNLEGMLDISPAPNPYCLLYGSLGDSGIALFDENLLPVFFLENKVEILEKFREMSHFPTKADTTLFWRKKLRNNPSARHLTFGSLTGEEEALAYLESGMLYPRASDIILFFSDGITPFLPDMRFRAELQRQLVNPNRAEAAREMKNCIGSLLPDLLLRGVKNLDDDKAFIALQLAA